METAYEQYIESLAPLRALLPGKQYTLLVDYVEDPGLPGLSASELQQVFTKTEAETLNLLGYTIHLKLRARHTAEGFIASRRDRFSHPITSFPVRAWYIDPSSPELEQFVNAAVHRAIKNKSPTVLENYFGKQNGTHAEYEKAITKMFLEKLHAMYAEQDPQGKPIGPPQGLRKEYMSFTHWSAIMAQERDADFVVANTLLTGPDATMPIYVINRGGVTSAFVDNNPYRPYQASGMISLYPFLSKGEFFNNQRGPLTMDERVECIAMIWVHELGHMLMRKAENYTLDGSVFRAPTDLRYKEWSAFVKLRHKNLKDDVPVLTKF